jgi:hypothetical protein
MEIYQGGEYMSWSVQRAYAISLRMMPGPLGFKLYTKETKSINGTHIVA